MADLVSAEPGKKGTLLLESLVLPEDTPFESLSPVKKEVLSRGSARSIVLWETEFSWFSPLPQFGLITTPGIWMDSSQPIPSDSTVRFGVSYVLQRSRKGDRFSSAAEVAKYLDNPTSFTPPAPSNAFKFIVPSTETPSFTATSGMSSFVNDEDNDQLGPSPVNNKRRKFSLALRGNAINPPTAPPKFSSTAHPYFELNKQALPPGTSTEIFNQARSAFSCSVSRNTQSNYATALRHLQKVESTLGRKFSLPMTDSEKAYFTVYMMGKGVKKATISGYLSALRFYEMSQGVQKPNPNSDLTKQLLTGHGNFMRDPMAALERKQRRPITGNILKLIGHALSVSGKSDYEQSLIWSVSLLAFWGSFRISELLCEFRYQHNAKNSLMPTDLKFNGNSVGVWLRSEKVVSEYGNVVEVWCLPQKPELDPVVALEAFLERRSSSPEVSSNSPIFVHSDGSNLTKNEFNRELKQLLNLFPELTDSSVDYWAGHSFRSGISTLLQGLGFSEEEIKSWGRWHSSAYLAYLKDMSARQATQARLTSTFNEILKNL